MKISLFRFKILSVVLLILCFHYASASSLTLFSDSTKINDGPYIFISEDSLIQKEIINGQLVTKHLPFTSYDTSFTVESAYYSDVKKIAALSDIHGQYDLAVEILINNNIINKKLKWNYGKGHLVIVGDIFDRGPKVTEMLWLVYELEKQAEEKGGKVHFLLGNHEYMVLNNDLRYVNEKYLKSAELMGYSIKDLYNDHSVLGRWIRSKPTLVKINNNLFVHAGVSPEFSELGSQLDSLNMTMRESIGMDKQSIKESSKYAPFYATEGPIWYRGYFRDPLNESQIDQLLTAYSVDRIIVGHTSQKKIVTLYNAKVIGVDTSIKKGKKGHLLFIEKGKLFKGTKKGNKKKL